MTNKSVERKEPNLLSQRQFTRRRLLTYGGASLAALALAGFTVQRCASNADDSYETVRRNVLEVLADGYGEIGREYRSERSRVVLAIGQIHSTQEVPDLMRRLNELDVGIIVSEMQREKYYDLKKRAHGTGTNLPDIDERINLLSRDIEESRQIKNVVSSSIDEIYHSQKNIYRTLLGLSRIISKELVVCGEGIQSGNLYEPNRSKLVVRLDANHIPVNERDLILKQDVGASELIKLALETKVVLVGADDDNLNCLSQIALRDSSKKEEALKLQIKRNKVAADAASDYLAKNDVPFVALVYGRRHFDEISPTILDFLRERKTSYIEIKPKTTH